MTAHTSIAPSAGGETDAPRRHNAVDRVPHELFIAGEWTPWALTPARSRSEILHGA